MSLGGDKQAFPQGEKGDGEGCHLHPVQKLRDAEGHAGLAGQSVDAHGGKAKADEERGQALQRRLAEGGGDGDEGQHHQGEVFARAEDQGEFYDMGRKEGQREGGDQARDE